MKITRQAGFSLIELSVAVLIALFLIGGVLTVEQGVHTSYQENSGLSQLEDNERFAMSLISGIIQRGGYYPNPATNTLLTALPAETTTPPNGVSSALANGQFLFGFHNSSHDAILVRYMTASGQNINLCDGTTGVTQTYANFLYVAADATNSSVNDLYCELQVGNGAAWNTAVPLVSGLKDMQINYGLHTVTQTQADNNVDTYKSSGSMASTDWPNVTSVQVTLEFLNPLYPRAGQPQYVYFTRVIAVMSRAGVEVIP